MGHGLVVVVADGQVGGLGGERMSFLFFLNGLTGMKLTGGWNAMRGLWIL